MRNSFSPGLLILLLNLVRDLTHASGIPQYWKFFKSGLCSTACADINVVPMFDVNYGFIFIDRVTNKAVDLHRTDMFVHRTFGLFSYSTG
jgi:hypothetical protein